MKIQSLKMAYFSPTGTTKAVVHRIATGINPDIIKLIDITSPLARKRPLYTTENELLIIGVPVYMGRVPALITDWLNAIQAHRTPTVCVVVYGNRVYDNALLELKDIVKSRGCVPIAGAAYIGEHSYSNAETPLAQGRPDEDDLNHAKIFGRGIRKKLQSLSQISQMSDVNVPGSFPYSGTTELWDVDFIDVNNRCNQCGICSEVCPVGAVDSQDSRMIDLVKCITCCACIKNCPQNSRAMKSGPVKDAAKRLHERCKERKKPQCFL